MALANKRLIRLPEVKHQTGIGRSSIYQRIRNGTFPAPIKIGPRSVAWLSSDVESWIEQQISAANNAGM